MVCSVAETARIVAQLLNGIVVVEESTCNRKCEHNRTTYYHVFDALLAIAAAQESLDCPSMWQRQGTSLCSFGVKLKIIAAKRTVLLQSLNAAVKYADYANEQNLATLATLLIYFAEKRRSKDSLSTVLKLLCRMDWYARSSFVSRLSSQDLDKLLLRCHDCYNDLAMFFTKFDNFILTKDQLIMLQKATLKRQPDAESLRAAQNLFHGKYLDDVLWRDIASWAVRAPQDVSSEVVDILHDLAENSICVPTQELRQLATLLPESPKLFQIYCSSALNGDYGGLEYLESFAQLDDALIRKHCYVMTRIFRNEFDAALRVCTRPGYEWLHGIILSLAFPSRQNGIRNRDHKLKLQFKNHRPLLEKWRQEFLHRVIEKCDYSPNDLGLLRQIQIRPIRPVGNSKECRADLLKTLIENCKHVRIECIHTLCEMAIVMQPGLEFDLRPCDKSHSLLHSYFSDTAINILKMSKNQTEVFAVLDAHLDPFDGLRYTGDFFHDAAVHVFETYKRNTSRYSFWRICDALGQVNVTDLQGPDIPRWKEVAAACTLALKYGYDQDTVVVLERKPWASLVIDYAKNLGASPSDIERLYEPLGAIAPMALCTTGMFSCSMGDAIRIARDPRAPELAKYHTEEFSKIALILARGAVFIKYMNGTAPKLKVFNFSFAEIAWVFAYLPSE